MVVTPGMAVKAQPWIPGIYIYLYIYIYRPGCLCSTPFSATLMYVLYIISDDAISIGSVEGSVEGSDSESGSDIGGKW